MVNLFLDIETLPTNRPEIITELRASVTPPATYKKPESIAAWMRENIDAETDTAMRKTALSGAFGRVCVIGFAIDDSPVQTVSHSDDEAFVLHEFMHFLSTIERHEWFTTTVVGHNVSAFDLRFLMHRCIINNVKPHVILSRAAAAKPWGIEVYDTMTSWDSQNRISLNKLCKALSIDTPKGDIDGSKVYDYVMAGKIDEVAEYCARDVQATRAVYKRMTFA